MNQNEVEHNFNNILYTPIDVEPPELDVEKIKEWAKKSWNKKEQRHIREISYRCKHVPKSSLTPEKDKSFDYSLNPELVFPWYILYPCFNNSQYNIHYTDYEFFEEHYMIVDFLCDFFDVKKYQIFDNFLNLPLLFTKKHVKGHQFWHSDGDYSGLRWYIDFPSYQEDCIFMRKLKNHKDYTYNNRKRQENNSDLSKYEKESLRCNIMKNNQIYFLNNFKGIHQTYTCENNMAKPRILFFILPIFDYLNKQEKLFETHFFNTTKRKVVESALKFQDYSIWC